VQPDEINKKFKLGIGVQGLTSGWHLISLMFFRMWTAKKSMMAQWHLHEMDAGTITTEGSE